jgi:peroxiredoxin
MTIAVGDTAPDFTLRGSTGDPVTLSSYRGERPVAVVFYPFTFTGVCQGELCQLRDDYQQFEQAGVQVLAISCDTAPAQKKWADEMGYQFPVLSDFWPHGEVSKAYGVFNDKLGCAMRYTFLVGKDGRVLDVFDSGAIGTPRESARYAEGLAKL